MKRFIPSNFLILPAALLILIPLVIIFLSPFQAVPDLDTDAVSPAMVKIRVVTVVTLVFAGILLCVGFVFLLRNRGWRETAADPPEARQTGLSVSGEHTAKKDNNSTNVINFDEAIHSINSSLERLQSLNDRIHEQNEALIRINQSLSGRRDFSLGTASSRNLQDKPAAGTARKDPIPFSSFHSPAPAPDKPAILTEAEILAIHINRIKTERELNFPQGTGYTGTPQ